MIALALGLIVLQTVPVPSVTATWNANPEPDIAGYHLIVDNTIYDVGNVTTYTVPQIAPGSHTAALTATNAAGLTSVPSAPVSFTVAGQAADPCAPPLGAHAPAIFPTSPTITTGKPGSRSFMNYQLAAPDPVVEVAIQIDDEDVAIGKGADLAAFSGMWFPQPIVGSHKIGVRVLTSFGCRLIRTASSPLVVK